MKSISDVNNARSAVSESQKIVEKILEVPTYVISSNDLVFNNVSIAILSLAVRNLGFILV